MGRVVMLHGETMRRHDLACSLVGRFITQVDQGSHGMGAIAKLVRHLMSLVGEPIEHDE